MLICRRDLTMARASLVSLLQHASFLPELRLAIDESLTDDCVNEEFADWPGRLICYTRRETEAFHKAMGRDHLAEFCRRDIFGYKMAACLRSAADHHTLYSDADVLWFGDCNVLMRGISEYPICGTADLGESVDSRVVSLMAASDQKLVLQTPRICAGMAVYQSGFELHEETQSVMRRFLADPEIGRLAEQTLINLEVRRHGHMIPSEKIRMVHPTSLVARTTASRDQTLACHYPGKLKQQFWIDTLRTA